MLTRHVEGAQVQQFGLAAAGNDAKAAQAFGRLAAVDGLEAAQVGDLAEQFEQLLGLVRVGQGADRQHQHTRLDRATGRVWLGNVGKGDRPWRGGRRGPRGRHGRHGLARR